LVGSYIKKVYPIYAIDKSDSVYFT